jgi:hypothetical protein
MTIILAATLMVHEAIFAQSPGRDDHLMSDVHRLAADEHSASGQKHRDRKWEHRLIEKIRQPATGFVKF